MKLKELRLWEVTYAHGYTVNVGADDMADAMRVAEAKREEDCSLPEDRKGGMTSVVQVGTTCVRDESP